MERTPSSTSRQARQAPFATRCRCGDIAGPVVFWYICKYETNHINRGGIVCLHSLLGGDDQRI